jgi:cytochrome c-type biogenesis protein CcmH
MSFVIIGAGMLLVAVGFIILPLLKHRRARPRETAAANRDIHEQRLSELRADVASGDLAEADYAAARHDLQVDFQTASGAAAPGARTNRGWVAAVVVAAVVPIAGGLLYLHWGNWQSALYGDHSLQAMTASVESRLQESPKDVRAWELLGRINSAARHYDQAITAFHRAVALTKGQDATALAALGSTEMLAGGMRAGPATGALFDRVLKLDPDNTRGLLYGGIIAMQQGRNSVAINRWQRLLKQNPPAPLRRILKTRIAAAGGKVEAGGAAVAAADTSSAIHVDVKLAATLRARVPDDATLFVFVRPADSHSGPPLAVRRLSVDRFPVEVSLSDKDAMIRGRHLEDYQHLRVVARISRSGAPLEEPGDVYGTTKFSWSEKKFPLDVVLDKVVSD